MAKTIENLFHYIHLSVNGILILLFFLFFKHTKKEIPLILIAVYALTDLGLNVFTTEFSARLYLYVWAGFTLIEYLIFSAIITLAIKKRYVKKIICYISVLYVVFVIIFNVKSNFKNIDSIPIGIETILILLFSFYYLYEQMNDTSHFFIYSKYQFWIIIGFMIYLSGSFFVYIFANGLSKSNNSLLSQYWLFTNVFYFFMIILFSISLFVNNKNREKVSQHDFNFYLS